MKERLGRPTWPLGLSTKVATFRPTRSCASAYLIARARDARASCRYLVDIRSLSASSPRRTSRAVSSRSGLVPMCSSSGLSASR